MDSSKKEKTIEEKFSIEKLKEFRDITEPRYDRDTKRMRLLDGIDKGRLWDVLRSKKPIYQMLPDTNFVSRTKNGLLASIYTVTKGANFAPSGPNDMSLIKNVNTFIDILWQKQKVGYYQFLAGERAALLNLGLTQVGWDKEKKEVALKNLEPAQFRRDPFAPDLEHAAYCYYVDYFHKSIILADPRYKEAAKEYMEDRNRTGADTPTNVLSTTLQNKDDITSAKDYYTVVVFWVRDGKDIHEIHTINFEKIIYTKERIKPAQFPIACLHCNVPAGDLIGISPCGQILANNIVYNTMESILYTAEYKAQRPPKFVNRDSGINIDSFMRYGDEADKTWIVQGKANEAVYYHAFPKVTPSLPMQMMKMAENIGNITGVDDRYTGRDTGSITTTGGTENMLARVTLNDTPKIMLYEEYTKQLSALIIMNYFEWNPKRTMFYQNQKTNKWESLEVELDKIDPSDLLSYEMNISSELPRTKQMLAAKADMLMQNQMQYAGSGQEVDLITPEEWMYFQDLGQATEMMLDRMKTQRMMDALTVASTIITNYSELMAGGVDPQQAMLEAASALEQTRLGGINPGEVTPEGQTPVSPGAGAPVL